MTNTVVDILLVEDREEDAELAMIALAEHQLANNIKWVKDGQEALDFLLAEGEYTDRNGSARPKVVLLDLKMPKVDGIAVLQTIRSTPRLASLPVVVLTTSKQEQDIIKAYELHVNSYIVKPVDFEQFSQSVKELGMYWLLVNEAPPK